MSLAIHARHLVAMKDIGQFVHRMSACHRGVVDNVFGETAAQDLEMHEFASMKTILEARLMSKYHDKIDLTVDDAQQVSYEDLLAGKGVVPQ